MHDFQKHLCNEIEGMHDLDPFSGSEIMGPSSLYTKNLILKVENESKAGEVLDLYKRNKSTFDKYEPTRPNNFYTKDYHFTHLINEYNAYMRGIFLRYFIYAVNHPTRIIGAVNFNIRQDEDGSYAEIGYKIDLLYQNRGIAYEACLNGINVMKKYYGIKRINAHIDPTNIASLKLAAKLGFKKTGSKTMCANVQGKETYLDSYALMTSEIQ